MTGNSQHYSAQRNIAHLNLQVNVIGHSAIGMKPHSLVRDYLTHNPIELSTISWREENGLAMIASWRDMINRCRHV